jgi:histidyl-tRNA synthetase
MKDAPLLQDFLSADDKGYHETVRWLLKGLVDSKTLNATLVHDPTLVRGLDYYEKTVFEFVSDELGAQSALAGGGRYDGLITQLGGPPSGGIGWAAGVERIISIANHEVLRAFSDAGPTLFIADEGEGDFVKSMVLAVNWRLRDEDRVAIFGDAKRSLRNQLKKADRLGADFVVIVGGERGAYDATIRNMRSGNQSDVNSNEEDFVGTVMSEIERLTMETSR